MRPAIDTSDLRRRSVTAPKSRDVEQSTLNDLCDAYDLLADLVGGECIEHGVTNELCTRCRAVALLYPVPAEPPIGSIWRDADGRRWVRTADTDSTPWAIVDSTLTTQRYATWRDVANGGSLVYAGEG